MLNKTTIADTLVSKDRLPDTPRYNAHIKMFNAVDETIRQFMTEWENAESDFHNAYYNWEYNLQLSAYNLDKNFNALNEEFRRCIKNQSEKSRKHSLYCLSLNGKKLEKFAEKEFNRNTDKKIKFRWNKKSKDFDKRKKVSFTPDKFAYLLKLSVAMLLAKYDYKVPAYMFWATAYKILITFFELKSVHSYQIHNEILTIRNNTDINEIRAIISANFLEDKKPYMRKKIKFSDRITPEEYRRWQDMGISQKQIQEELSKAYNVSITTVRRDMKEKSVSMQKYTRNTYLDDAKLLAKETFEERYKRENAKIILDDIKDKIEPII